MRPLPSAFIRQIWSIWLTKQANAIFPDGGLVLPLATGEGMDEGGSVPLTIVGTGATEVNVGNTVAVRTPGTGAVVGVAALVAEVGAVGVMVVRWESPIGVEVGFGFGGFFQTKTNPPIRIHRPNTPQPRPLNKNLSNVAISFLGDFIVSTNSKA